MINEGIVSAGVSWTPLTVTFCMLRGYLWIKQAWESAFGMFVMRGIFVMCIKVFPALHADLIAANAHSGSVCLTCLTTQSHQPRRFGFQQTILVKYRSDVLWINQLVETGSL